MSAPSRPEITDSAALRELIRRVAIKESDPAAITRHILGTLTADEARVVATVTLHEYIRNVISRPLALPANTVDAAAAPRMYETRDGRRTRSAKVAGIRDWVANELARKLCVEGDAKWKPHGACTADELRFLAAKRDHQANEVAAEGKKFLRQAEAIERAKVNTLAELDRATLETVL